MNIEKFNFNQMKEELNKIEIFNFDSSLGKYIDGISDIDTFESIKKSKKYILVDNDKKIENMLKDIKKYSIVSLY